MPKVFLSYRHVAPDEECAAQLGAFLQREGFEVFLDKHILAGQRWVEQIDRELRSADHFIVLLSADSIRSDMVRQEVTDAYALSRQGHLRIYPVRVAFEGALPYDLASYLNPLQYLLWKTGDSWDPICRGILQAIRVPQAGPSALEPQDLRADDLNGLRAITDLTGAPLPAADPRLDTGAVDLDSPFYVRRTVDKNVERMASAPGKTVLIKGPRQVGKTSLLTRAKGAAERNGQRVVYLDFQLVDEEHLATLKSLALYMAHRIARTLRTSVKPAEVWDDYLGAPESLTDFIEQAVLSEGALTICCDEVDRIFDYPYRNAFFAMVRAWHNRRATNAAWKPFGLLLAHSTEPALFIDDLNQSPFNVGEVFRLGDFERSELEWLNQRHNRPLTRQSEMEALHSLLGGHPYLSRQALYVLATGRADSLADLIATAADDEGPFGDHLRRHLFGLTKRPQIAAVLKSVLRDQGCDDEGAFQRLKAAGLVDGPLRTSARVRCDLYERYFSRHL